MAPATEKIKAIFLAALDRTQFIERAAFLNEACADDADLRMRVEALLQAHDQADRLLDRPAADHLGVQTSARNPVSEQPGTVVADRYKLLEQIGEGGMGTVWVAEQTQPVRRKVAVKLIKAGMDSKQVLNRFEAERQALALMDHPHIAKVFDGGTTENGRPFFAMEYVKGVPITQYCDEARLNIAERLALFVPVCQAVQHAHQKGIIHRDLKPSNILVCPYDGIGVPKVIDFGLAKAMQEPLTEHTVYTAHGLLIGTPLYMSPEQAEINNLDVDTRADIYALGVILYELLTGTTPLENQRLKMASWPEMLRLIKEEETPLPSARLSKSATLPNVAAQRQLEPARLTKQVRGELDWVVMKALEKDRNRRYETASSFALDLGRYMAGEPVLAAPPSTSYRLRKFLHKHRVAVLAVVAFTLLLLAGVAVSTWQAVRATNAEAAARFAEQAAAARAEGERKAKEQAERERDAKERALQKEAQERKYAQAITDFVKDDFLALTSVEGQERFGGQIRVALDKDATLRQLLDRAAEKLQRHDLDPRIEAELRWMIGVNYRGLGEAELAIPFLQRCVMLRKKLFGPDHEATLQAQNSLAVTYLTAGKVDQALPLFEETLKLAKASRGADHPQTMKTMSNLGLGYRVAGKLDPAQALVEEALRLGKAKLGRDHPETLTSMDILAAVYHDTGKLDQALPLWEEALRLSKAKLGANHWQTLTTLNNLALGYRAAGKWNQALPLFEEYLKLTRAKQGIDHPNTLTGLHNLASCYLDAGRLRQALPLLEETFKRRKAKLGADHPDTLTTMQNLGVAYYFLGKVDLAVSHLEETVKRRKAQLGADHHETLTSMASLAASYHDARKLNLALPLYEETLKRMKATLGIDHPKTLSSMNNLAEGFQAVGKLYLALPLYEEAFKRRKATLGADNPATLMSMNNLANGYYYAGKLDQALPLWEETLRLRNGKLGADHHHTLTTMNNLAAGYDAAGKLDQALPLWEETLRLRKTKLGADHPDTLITLDNLAKGYSRAGKLNKALPLYREAAANMEKGRFEHKFAALIVRKLIDCHERLMEFKQAESWRRKWLAVVKERFGSKSLPYASELGSLALNLFGQKKWADADPILRDCLAILTAKQPDAWTTFWTQSMLGGALLGQKKYAEAEPLLLKGYEGMKQCVEKIPSQARMHLIEALARLVALYEATDKKDEAARWGKELAKAREQ